MLLHLLRAEQLGAQRRGVAVFSGAVSREAPIQQVADDSFAAFFEFAIAFV
jgi:hypothetical protein